MSVVFRQLFDRDTCTYTYILGDVESREAVVIDPVVELVERDLRMVAELGLVLKYTIDTHVHADHVTGAGTIRERCGAKVVYPAASQVDDADKLIADGEALQFGSQTLIARSTPGHTESCMTWIWVGQNKVFTGDTLMVRGCGRTDFQGGSSEALYRSVREVLFTMAPDTELYPGHDYKGRTKTTVHEECTYNPRLGTTKSSAEFVEIMANLGLAYPQRIDVALPANLRAGVVE